MFEASKILIRREDLMKYRVNVLSSFKRFSSDWTHWYLWSIL